MAVKTVQRMMLKVDDGPDELVTIVEHKSGGKVVIRNQYGFKDTVSKRKLYAAPEDLATFKGTDTTAA